MGISFARFEGLNRTSLCSCTFACPVLGSTNPTKGFVRSVTSAFSNGRTLQDQPTRKPDELTLDANSWQPTLDTLRNLFLTPTTEMLPIFRQLTSV